MIMVSTHRGPFLVRPACYPGDHIQTGWHILSLDGELLATPTVNLGPGEGQYPADGCVFLKVSEHNNHYMRALQEANLIELTGRIIGAGFVKHYAVEARCLDPRLLHVK